MLAYDLFLKNDQRNYNPILFNVRPIKKIFIKKKEIVIDGKGIEHYDSKTLDDYKEIQNLWQMPLNTTKKDTINIPNDNTSPRQDPPYLIIEGELKSNKEKKPIKIIFTTKKFTKNELKFEYDLEKSNLEFITKKDDENQTHKVDKKIALKINIPKNYLIENQSLLDAYKVNQIIQDDNTIKFSTIEESLKKFCNYIKNKIPEKVLNGNFEIYVLPIEAKEKEIKNKLKQFGKPSFKDSFGNTVSDFASGNTRTASFLSFNEDYFTIKYIQDKAFYENLGIGIESLDKVELPKQEMFHISGFDWWFFSQEVPANFDFKRYGGGIFKQLYQNYKELSRLEQSTIGRVNLHVTCFKPDSKKLEVIIDENLTMKKLERLFSIIPDEKKIPRNVFEDSLIIKIGRTTIWHNYIIAVRAFLSEIPVDSFFLMKIFIIKIQNKIFDWIKQKGFSDASEFFKQAWFCYKILTRRDKKQMSLDNNENFAYNVGKLAGRFFNFASKLNEANKTDKNRYSGILTYTKYDKTTLERIFKRIGWWFGLLPSDNERKAAFLSQALETVKNLGEMSDSNKDYSFFFYKGFFEEAGEKNH